MLYAQDHGKTTRVSIIGPRHTIVEHVGTVPNPYKQGQIIYSQINGRYGEFVYTPMNGQAASFHWTIYLWDRGDRTLKAIAHNPTDTHGTALPGGWVEPALTQRYIYWIQAIPRIDDDTGSQLVQYDIATRRMRILYSGLVLSFVPFGDTVLYSAVDKGAHTDNGSAPPMHLAAISADSGRFLTLVPAGLSFAPETVNTIRAAGDLVVWADGMTLRAWTPAWGRSKTVVPDVVNGTTWPAGRKIQAGVPTFPRLYGPYLIWSATGTFVLDLRTNSFARINAETVSGIDMSGPMLSIESYTHGTTFDRATNTGHFDEHLLDLRHVTGLPACGR